MSYPPDRRVGDQAEQQTHLLEKQVNATVRLAEAQECANLMAYIEMLRQARKVNPDSVDTDHVDMVTKKIGTLFEKVLLRRDV